MTRDTLVVCRHHTKYTPCHHTKYCRFFRPTTSDPRIRTLVHMYKRRPRSRGSQALRRSQYLSSAFWKVCLFNFSWCSKSIYNTRAFINYDYNPEFMPLSVLVKYDDPFCVGRHRVKLKFMINQSSIYQSFINTCGHLVLYCCLTSAKSGSAMGSANMCSFTIYVRNPICKS